MKIQERTPLKSRTTFRMGGDAAYFCELHTKDEVAKYVQFAEDKKLPLIILGGGSNSIFPDSGLLNVCVGHIAINGFAVEKEDALHAYIRIGAGEDWDSVAHRSVAMELSGIEALSSIPGTAGATPIQNVGAYGQEIKDTLIEVEAYDRAEKAFKIIPAIECGLTYRDSKFKHEWKNRYIITSLLLRLSRAKPTIPSYPGVKAYLQKTGITEASLSDIRSAIIEIRKNKLPDPKVIASCGSFFKNPMIDRALADAIKLKYPSAVLYPAESGLYKVGAGWMIEMVGLKGKDFGAVGVYPHNALVLVNQGNATKTELNVAVETITSVVEAEFSIRLEIEPVFIEI